MIPKEQITASAGRLRRRLETLQDHQRGVWLVEAFGLFVAAVLAALGSAMVLDNLLHLPMAVRLLALAGLAGIAVLLVRWGARLLREPLTAERMAVKVEQKFPQMDNAMINALLLAREDDAEASELIHAVVEQGNAGAARADLTAAIPKRRLAAALGAAALVLGGMAAYGILYPSHFANALARVLVPFAGVRPLTQTKIVDVTPKNQNVLVGNDVTIGVQLAGKLPDSVLLVYTPENDQEQVAVMRPGDAPGKLQCLMADVSRTFAYHIVAGDAESDAYTITAHHRPAVTDVKLEIAPPAYTGLPAASQDSGTVRALPGSRVDIRATCSKPIAKAALVLSTAAEPLAMAIEGGTVVTGSFPVKAQGSYHIDLTDTAGFPSKPVSRDIELLPDEPPEIALDSPPAQLVVKPEATLPFQFTVTDRYGVASAQIVRLHPAKEGEPKETDEVLADWQGEGKTQKVLQVTHPLPVAKLGIEPGKSASLQVVAKDWNDVTGPGVTRSGRITVTILSPEEAENKSRETTKLAAVELAQIIQKQRRNIADGEILRASELKQPGSLAGAAEKLAASIALQEEIRAASGKLLALMDERLPLRGVLQVLFDGEMLQAVTQLRTVARAEKPADALKAALDTERVILARLTGRMDQLQRAMDTAALRDIFAVIDELIREQQRIRTDTQAAAEANAAQGSPALAQRQDKLTARLAQLKEMLQEQARLIAKSDAEQATRFDEAAKMIDSRQIRQNMLLAASRIEKGQFAPALPEQDKVMADLRAIAEFLRAPIIAAAAEKLENLKKTLEEAKDKAEKLAKLQAAVKEISEELERSKDNRGDKAKEVATRAAELEGVKEKIEDAVEQMAKDLALFPEVPSCNELVQEMREVFEDITQVPGSESAPAEEIAVDRDEGMLAALDKVKERMADMEMWLMDKPDAQKWKQEAWDKNEMPNIPLVDLPQEMEDLVGDLVDKQEEVDEQAQDSASNAATADIPAGWDVADGPISNWSAKGKSGNEKPNANEMAGRSGAGREGNANGELVDGKAKDLEGRETKARRTHDPFGEGQIDEENPESKAKATGGGKQSGIGGEGGLSGTAPPRNELALRDLERRQREVRRDAETVYSKATLMYLPTGELDEAIVLMQKAEQQARAGDLVGFAETQRRIVHALQNTKRAAAGEGAVALDPRHRLPTALKEEMLNAKEEPIPPEFERLVSEYYKAIAAGAVK
ncbi:MAG TPA: hypothetical protein PLE19_02525 [Planctomycetota bacterium]|nr:hypothetical protein [Planctomycetota bacterium]HRR80559.1 hypothetical protein [Planctomycetota bacterium]HRT93308.1 hypothetical protein [Planctomycetota bacterium]